VVAVMWSTLVASLAALLILIGRQARLGKLVQSE
jgi:hypothetical protein